MDLIEAGKIANTHGVRGEVRVDPWCDSPEFLCGFKTLYIDGAPVAVLSAKPHKNQAIMALEGVEDVTAAMALKGRVVWVDAAGIKLPEGKALVRDLIGLDAIDAATGLSFGRLTGVLPMPAHDVYEVKGEKSYLIPAVKEFVQEINVEGGYIKFRLIEGLAL